MTTTTFDRITINPKQCGGQPCVRGMRIRIRDVLDMLANGASQAEILTDFPDLQPDDIRASIAYVNDVEGDFNTTNHHLIYTSDGLIAPGSSRLKRRAKTLQRPSAFEVSV